MVIIDFIKWKSIDAYREIIRIKNGQEKRVHIYGIEGYFGLPGAGKTMAMTEYIRRMRQKYGDKIYIMTNYYCRYQDFEFRHWKQLLKEYDKPLICAWDEVQNEFSSREFRNFPVELLTILTQNRKGHGKKIIYSAQRWDRVDKVFRELTHYAYDCKTIFGRLTRVKKYHWEDYVMKNDITNVDKKMKIRPISIHSFVQDDELRESYDSYKMLESAKSKEYMTRDEVVKLL